VATNEPSRHLSSGPLWRQSAGLLPGSPAYAFDTLGETVWDVVVVGGGLTGVTTALLLARAGCRVALLEARELGSGTTGSSTAKVSLLQGTTISAVRNATSADTARAYVEANLEAQAWVGRYADEHEVAIQHRSAYTYANTDQGAPSVQAEIAAAQEAGLPVQWVEHTTLPFPVAGAAVLGDQRQLDPRQLLTALALDAEEHGAVLVQGVVAHAVAGSAPVVVSTDAGEVRANQVVVATNLPFLDRGGHFARAEPLRSYALAYRTPRQAVDGMYLSADEPSRSLRDVPDADGSLLLVGGSGHVTGRADSPSARLAELDRWTLDWFPEARLVHQWSAQDYRTSSHVPWAGPLLPRHEEVLVAGGYGKWGMTNAVAAALALTARILDGHVAWAEQLYAWGHPTPAAVAQTLRLNAKVAGEMALGWAKPWGRTHRAEPDEGEGLVVADRLGTPTATARVNGQVHRVSAVCPHLGGILRWNDAERSWDCPLHGSRFTAAGVRLEGPATCGLRVRS
jgi:glycine/D-amino acid oxidase-like deaminating enzyme/nitrite reductase/ring-hydroxylating ferredoxin subunit